MKIAIVGGGSLMWAFGFSRQIIHSQKLRPMQLVLHDIDAEALQLVAAAVGHYNAAGGNPIRIETDAVLESALSGADYVLVSISTGGLQTMRHDLEIPEQYGIYHTVGDTVGPGGWLRAVRNIPVFHHLAETMQRYCPDAWMLNVSNPLTPLTRVPHRNFGIKTIGMCPGVENTVRALARLAGASKDAPVDYVVSGIDHGSWLLKLHAGNMDVLKTLKTMGYCRSDDKLPERQMESDDPIASNPAWIRAGFAVWREIGYLPSIADRHTIENWPWFLPSLETSALFGIKRTSIADRTQYRREARENLEAYLRSPNETALGALSHGDDPVVKVIEALNGFASMLWGSNYMNVGQIPGFPEGAVVETRCLFDAAGVHPLCSPMPDLLKALVLPQVLRQEAIIDVALTGSFDELVALVTTDPLCSRVPFGQCREMVGAMLKANRSFIRNPRLLENI